MRVGATRRVARSAMSPSTCSRSVGPPRSMPRGIEVVSGEHSFVGTPLANSIWAGLGAPWAGRPRGATGGLGSNPNQPAHATRAGRVTLSGQGVGSTLVRGALDALRAEGSKVVPRCEFVAACVERHPEYRDSLAEEG
jgi:GCN5-related N-acetyltransferase